jgi:serine/threonine protein kinase
MIAPKCLNSKCPPDDALTALVMGDELAPPALSDHVGECTGCQERLESFATAGVNHLSATVRGLDRIDPPSKSAFWPALNAAEAAVTREFHNVDTDPEDDEENAVDLSFLRPSPVPGRIGRLGEFDVVRVIGKGGMGVVLHAFDTNLLRDVAIKILDPHLATNSTARQRFCREARSAAAVTHDNLVTVYQVDEDSSSGLPFLVMQLVVGESLEQRLRRSGKLSVPDAVRLGVQTAAGLAAAHASGLIHRDIKPGNILIERDTEKALLTDFGLARATEDLKLTKTGMVAGTPLYMAPEQANGLDPDARADLFSLGSVLYESLAGKPAFDARTPLAVLRRIADENHVPLRKVNPDVPNWLDEVVEGLLKKDPKDRIPTARDVVERLASHAQCVIPPLVGKSGDHCTVVKSASQAIISTPPLRRFAATLLAGTFAIGAMSGGVGTLLFAPAKVREKIVEVEKPLPLLNGNGNGMSRATAGPEPLGFLESQDGAIWSLMPDKTGKMLAVGYESGRVQIWDLIKQRVSSGFEAHKGPVWVTSYSPDGKTLITASDDNVVTIRNLETGKTENLDHPNAVRAAAMYWDRNLAITGDRNGTVRIWDLEGQNPTAQLKHGAAINAIALSPDRLGMASSGSDGRIVLWDITANNERKRNELKGVHRGPVYGMAYNSDGTLLASAGWDGQVVIWDPNKNIVIKQFKAHEEGVWAVDFSPCCKFLATAGQDGLVKLWDVGDQSTDSAKLLATFYRHKGTVHTVHFFADGSKIASGGRDGTAMVWDVSSLCGH